MTVPFDAITPVPGPVKRAKAEEALRGRRERQERAAEARRELLLDVAWVMLKEVGVDALNMRDLGARAGYTAGALYSYFPSRAHVIEALRQRLLVSIAARVERAARPSAKGGPSGRLPPSARPKDVFERCTLAWWQALSGDRNALALLLAGQTASASALLSRRPDAAGDATDLLNELSDATQTCALALEGFGMDTAAALGFHRDVLCLGVGMLVMQPTDHGSAAGRKAVTQRFQGVLGRWRHQTNGDDNGGILAPLEGGKVQDDLFGS